MGPPPRSFAADAHDCIMVPILTDRPNTRMGPPPRSFAADAHDCIMVPILTDRPNTRLWRDLRARWQAPLELSSFGRTAGNVRPTNLACRRARDRQVAFAMACGHP